MPILNGTAMRLFGAYLLAPRLVTLVFAVATVLVTYLLGRELYDRETGFTAVLFLLSLKRGSLRSGTLGHYWALGKQMDIATVVGYVEQLISAGDIPRWEQALGLYVIGRPDPDIRQLEDSIVAQGRTDDLRTISVDSLLSLAELISGYDVSHDDVLAVLHPSGPRIDPVVDLMTRLIGQREQELDTEVDVTTAEELPEGEATYWISPVKSYPEESATASTRAGRSLPSMSRSMERRGNRLIAPNSGP